MCDKSAEVRRKIYAILRKAGFSRSFSQRARDFQETTLKNKHGIEI